MSRPPDEKGYARLAPDLAVEVVSPSHTMAQIHDKVCDYLDAGTPLVWVIEPRRQSVLVYRSRKDIELLGREEVLTAGEVLPGFELPVAVLFGERPDPGESRAR